MKKSIGLVFISFVCLFGNPLSEIKIQKFSQKGERIVSALCNKQQLPQAQDNLDVLIKAISISKACGTLSPSRLKAVAYYIQKGHSTKKNKHINVPKDAKCPVCGMYVHKYPKWVALMKREEKTYYFDGVKDMMKYYIFDGNFPYLRNTISQMLVSDYYTLVSIPAKKAFYVVDSDVYGPMGHEIIPFKSKEKAESFAREHHGKMVVTFHEITDSMVMALDGIIQ